MPAMVGERSEEGFAALTLESEARGGLVAVFVPEAGMICCSLRHRGEELLGQRNGLRAYVDHAITESTEERGELAQVTPIIVFT